MSFPAQACIILICIKGHAQGVLKLAQTDSTEDSIEILAIATHADCKDLKLVAENCDTHISLVNQ